tara:strand:+ start:996 stop:1496 length:501 start_codon:yes stop_codon:yes gene_type:complete
VKERTILGAHQKDLRSGKGRNDREVLPAHHLAATEAEVGIIEKDVARPHLLLREGITAHEVNTAETDLLLRQGVMTIQEEEMILIVVVTIDIVSGRERDPQRTLSERAEVNQGENGKNEVRKEADGMEQLARKVEERVDNGQVEMKRELLAVRQRNRPQYGIERGL